MAIKVTVKCLCSRGWPACSTSVMKCHWDQKSRYSNQWTHHQSYISLSLLLLWCDEHMATCRTCNLVGKVLLLHSTQVYAYLWFWPGLYVFKQLEKTLSTISFTANTWQHSQISWCHHLFLSCHIMLWVVGIKRPSLCTSVSVIVRPYSCNCHLY